MLMFRVALAAVLIIVALGVLPAKALADGAVPEGLPPGVHTRAHPLMSEMVAHMQAMEMSPQQMQMMMADMEMMAEDLPPGVYLEMLRLMNQMDAEAMMDLHAMVHSGDMAEMSPGSLVAAAQKLVRH